MTKIFEQLQKFLDDKHIHYELIEHEPVFTSEQAAAIRGLGLQNGAKSLLLKVNNEYMMFVLPGNRKLDSKKVKQLTGSKKIRFATPEEVLEVTGTQIGAVYPFGEIAAVKMVVDKRLAENEIIAFNPGVHHKSVIMKWSEYQKATDPTLVDMSQE